MWHPWIEIPNDSPILGVFIVFSTTVIIRLVIISNVVFTAFTKVWFTLVQTKRRKKKKPGGGDVAYGDLPSLPCLPTN